MVLVLIYSLRNSNYKINYSWFLLLVSILFIVCGILLLIRQNRLIIQAFDKRKWPTTIGEIINSEVAGKRAYHPQITYKYQIEGKTYTCSTDLHISGFGNKRLREFADDQ